MKTWFALGLALLVATSSQAQILRPHAVRGAFWGGVAGAVIGHNSGDLRHNAWRGAAIGAGTGLLLGNWAADAHERRYGMRVPQPDYPRTYLYREPVAYYGADYSYGYDEVGAYGRPNYAGTGLLLGALAGAVIGHNSGDLRHNGWRGAALGGAAGLLLGSVAENRARQREASAVQGATVTRSATSSEPATPASAPVASEAAAPPQPSSMAAANHLFGRE